MAEISNSTLALLVLVTLGAVVVTTIFSLNQAQTFTGLTGRATTGDGNISLSISSTLAIQVDPGNATINYGTCTPRAGSSYSCATNDAVACDGVAGNNCTGDNATTGSQYIRVINVGNVDANLTMYNGCSVAQLIGGTSPALTYQTTHCNGTNVTSWTNVPTAESLLCSNISYRGPGAVRVYTNVTIPQDAAPSGCNSGVATVYFTAQQI